MVPSGETVAHHAHVCEEAGVRIVLHAHPAINLALVHNGVPLITALEVTNTSEAGMTDLTVTVYLHAEGSEAIPVTTRTYDGTISAGADVIWDDFGDFVPAVERLEALNESYRATLTITVTSLWTETAQLTVPITVLAHNEWLNAPVFYDSLAAFVQPNTRAVAEVLDSASNILKKQTGDSSLGGYQKGPERAAMIAAAVYEALRMRRIRYIDPPASFENSGQKVRTTAQVLGERFGTCIDLSVTFAACLEAAGIRPLIWLCEGHAFTGFLRVESALAHPSLTEENTLVNLVESGRAVPVEAIYYEGGNAGLFKAAVSKGRSHFADPSRLRGVVCITAARKDGIRPLPSLDDVPIQTIEPDEVSASRLELPGELLDAEAGNDAVLDTTDTSPTRVRKWKRALLDLSTRNRLLNLRPSAQVIDLHIPTSGLALLDDMAHSGTRITLTPNDELSAIHQLQGARRAAEIDPKVLLKYLEDDRNVYAAVTKETYVKRFKGLLRASRTMLEETGSANLYLTLGALIHRTPAGAEARAPLFLLPVKIVGGSGQSSFGLEIDTSGVASPNYCLVQWLRLKHNVTIESLESPKLDHSGIDIDFALRGIRSALVEHKLDLRVDEVATVSICQFGTFGMWKDLNDHWPVLAQSPLVQHLTHHAGESFRDPGFDDDRLLGDIPVDEASIPVPIAADGSQLRAVALAAKGATFVLEGPPGTGKSQTITNLIAHSVSEGKTVLFVAEKQAALDVVKKRLTKIGLAEFTLDLHGKKQTPNEIREQLRVAIDNLSRYNDSGWTARLAEFRARLAPLEDYPQKIHGCNGVDESFWSAYESSLAVGDGVIAPVSDAYVVHPQVPPTIIIAALEQFSRAARAVTIAPGTPWSIAGPYDSINAEAVTAAGSRLSKALDAAGSGRVPALLECLSHPQEIDVLLTQARRQLGYAVPEPETLRYWHTTEHRSAREGIIREVDYLQRNCAPILSTFSPMFIESGDIAASITQAESVDKGFFGKSKRLAQFEQSLMPFAAEGADLAPAVVLPILRAIPGVRDSTESLQERVKSTLGSYAPPYWNPLDTGSVHALDGPFAYISDTVEFAGSAPQIWQHLMTVGFPDEREISVLAEVAQAWREWTAALRPGPEDLVRWANGRHWLTAWREHSSTWTAEAVDGLSRGFLTWSRMSSFLDPLRESGLDSFADQLLRGEVNSAEATVAFVRGMATASLSERRNANGLNIFDTALRDGEIDDFAQAAKVLRQEQTKALPAKLLADRPFKAGALRGEVGELRRLLDRKRDGVSFRNLMNRYGEYILAATPVVFVSPASLSQFIAPGAATFDLVVFDEASQVPVPQAMGALGRGRSAVIVGDSQQMPPTSIGQVNVNDDQEADEEGAVVPDDLESILTECVDSGVPRLWLSWHYRSQDESLINFSNQKYYEGRLASLPSPGGDETSGVEWRRVDGHFNREERKNGLRTNRVEAEAIVAEIRERLATPHLAEQSIGVVTFNAQQQSLVQDLLEESEDPLVLDRLRPDAEEAIFVKNLENVQGDERDVILFSAAFSKRPGESRLPLNFGPLTTTGGEKRFNVAITRARRKVVIFTSFDPSDLDLSRTRSVGLAHLRAYLEMAAHGIHPAVSTRGDAVDDGDAIQREICDALGTRGYVTDHDFGLSDFVLDIVVRGPESPRWQVALMLDGPRWAERQTVADRDLTPRLLEPVMHWGAALRIWLPDWIDSPEAVLERIDSAMAKARSREAQREAESERAAERTMAAIVGLRVAGSHAGNGRGVPSIAAPAEPNDGHSLPRTSAKSVSSQLITTQHEVQSPRESANQDAAERDWSDGSTMYVTAPTTVLGGREDLYRVDSRTVRLRITEAIRETVAIEGPIELDRLARSIGGRFGYTRVSSNGKDFILGCVPEVLVHRGNLGEFAWPEALDADGWRGYRTTPEGISRPLAEVAPEEIVNAMAAVCRGRELGDEPLMRETLLMLNGQKRLTQGSSERLEACIAFGIGSGRLLRIEGLVRSGS